MTGTTPRLVAACAVGAAVLLTTVTAARAEAPPVVQRTAGHSAGSARHHPPVDITVTGFDRPESVLHDEQRDVYLVSNITNGPRDADNTGFISRLAPDGRILDLKWIAGGVNGVTLNAPKGTTIARGVLYVADIDRLRMFDARTGAPLGSLAPPGAIFLNDVTSDPSGTVYVTDIGFTTVPVFGPSGADAVYKVSPRGAISVLAAGNALLNHPNGVAAAPDGTVRVVTYDPFNGTQELFTLDRRGRKTDVVTLPTGLLDGIVLLKSGTLVSSWVDFSNATAGVIYLVGRDGSITQVAGGFQNASDIGFDRRRGRMLIPELPDPGAGGRVVIRTLSLP
jgi:sugar lactone lactonase YvrE